jgi:signal recognition particle receptor subunit beta
MGRQQINEQHEIHHTHKTLPLFAVPVQDKMALMLNIFVVVAVIVVACAAAKDNNAERVVFNTRTPQMVSYLVD